MSSGSRVLGCGCLVLVLLVLLGIVGSAAAAPLSTPFGELRFRCTLGLEHTNASITMRGPFAGHECRKMLDQTDAFPVRIFSTSHIANAPVVCSFTQSHVKVTIRDDGVLQLLGDNLCTVVRNIVADITAPARIAGLPGDSATVGLVAGAVRFD